MLNALHGNIYLIGMMAAGKTTIGRQLAERLRCRFIDTDKALEKSTGVSISHIFEIEGESGFRKRESKLLREIAEAGRNGIAATAKAHSGAVISTGGGIILTKRNRLLMRETGAVVYLRATLETLWSRLKDSHARPLLEVPNPKSKLAELLAERGPLYAATSAFSVDVGADSSSRVAQDIVAILHEHGWDDRDFVTRASALESA